jgi:uncharacterized protein YpbB
LLERTKAASAYFINEMNTHLLTPLKKHVDDVKNKSKTKKYAKELYALKLLIDRKQQQVREALQIANALHQSVHMSDLLQLVEEQQKPKPMTEVNEPAHSKKKSKPAKGDTQKVSLEMFKEGKTVAAIAEQRKLAQGTVEGHLASFIATGQVDILELVSKEKLHAIEKLVSENPGSLSSEIREKSANAFAYGEIKAVMNWMELQKMAAT